jgi:hypothetical protein
MRLKPLDLVIVLAAAGAVAYSAALAYGSGKGRAQVTITGRDGEWIYPLSSDREVSIAGPLGDTIVEIRGKSVRVEDSPCPNKTCIAAGAISRPNQWIACLPNRVLVRIEGGGADEEDVDAGVY